MASSSSSLRRLLMSSNLIPKSLAPNLTLARSASSASRYFITSDAAEYGDDGEGDFHAEETEKAFYVRLNLPEVEKKDVKVEVNRKENLLTVTGKAGLGRHWSSYDLPEQCLLEDTKAEMNDGVLKVVVPKELNDQETSGNIFTVEIE